MPSPTRQVPTGVASAFWWLAPPGEVTVVGTVQIRPPTGSGTETLSLTQRGSSEAVTVNSDRRTLAAAGITAADWDGLAGPTYGQASLSMDSGAVIPVRVQRVEGTTVYLADEVPRDAGDAGTLVSRLWRGALPAAVYGAVARGWSWLVVYTRDAGAGLGGALTETDRGQLDAVARVWSTGVGHEDVAQYLPSAIASRPGREMHLGAAVDGAEVALRQKIERWAARSGHYVDQTDGAAFRDIHAKMAAHRVLMGHAGQTGRPDTLEVAAAIMDQVSIELDDVLNGWVWIDIDEDGATDPGEIAVRAPTQVRGRFTDTYNTTLETAGMVRSTLGRER